MSVLHDEIYEQPEALRRVLAESRAAVNGLVAAARRRDVRYLVLAARGTSDNAATYAKYLFQIACGVPVALAAPSVHTLYDADVDYRGALVIGVSQSGAGEDIAEVVRRARRSGALTAALTNTADSPLVGEAEHVLLCHAGVERAVAATKTYTTTLAVFAALAAAWGGDMTLREGLSQIGDTATRALASESLVAEVARTLTHAERILTVARGLHLSTAIEAALKLAETSYIAAQPFSSADLLHGPIASVAPNTPCLLFAPNGATAAGMDALDAKLREKQARVLRLSGVRAEAAADAAPGHLTLPLADPGTELLAPLVDILPAQLLAFNLARARGLDPDRPRGLTKVTITR